MSLDLSNKVGRAHNTTAFTGADFAAVDASTFDSGNIASAGNFLLQTDLTANAMDANTLPTSMLDANGVELLTDGVELTIVKVDPTRNNITFVDPITGITYSYVDRPGESLTLVMDRSTTPEQWAAKV